MPKKLFSLAVRSLIAVSFLQLVAQGQDVRRLNVNAGGGYTRSVGESDGRLSSGWNVTVGAGYNFNEPFGIVGEYSYNGLGVSDSAFRVLGLNEGKANVISLTANPTYRFGTRSTVGGYVIGGGGAYRRSVDFSKPTFATIVVVDPWWGYSGVGVIPTGTVLGSVSTWAGGWNAGGGVTFRLGGSDTRFYAEFRYHRAYTRNSNTELEGDIPIPGIEYRILRKDGEPRWVLNHGVVLRRGGGQSYRCVGTVTDITERKLAEEALRRSEDLNKRIIDSTRECIKLLDLEGNLLFMNQDGQKMLEISEIGDYLRRPWLDFWKGKDREVAQRSVASARAGVTNTFQGYGATIKGAPKWWENIITPLMDADGAVVQLLAISRDITEAKRAEESLRESEKRFRTLIHDLHIGVLVQGPDAQILVSNQAALDLLGLTEDQLIGKTSFDPDWNVIHEDGSLFPGETHPVPQAIATRRPVCNVVMGVYRQRWETASGYWSTPCLT